MMVKEAMKLFPLSHQTRVNKHNISPYPEGNLLVISFRRNVKQNSCRNDLVARINTCDIYIYIYKSKRFGKRDSSSYPSILRTGLGPAPAYLDGSYVYSRYYSLLAFTNKQELDGGMIGIRLANFHQ